MSGNKYLIICVAAMLSAACAAANMQQRGATPNTNIAPSPLAVPCSAGSSMANDSSPVMPRSSALPASIPCPKPTPYKVIPPTAEQVDVIFKTAVKKLGLQNAQITTLDRQPIGIVFDIAESERGNEPDDLKWIKDIRIVAGERDLNHDGKPEKIIVQFTGKGGGSQNPTFKFYGLKQRQWECLTCPAISDLGDEVTFVSKGTAGEYDILRTTYEPFDIIHLELSDSELAKWKEYIVDTKTDNGFYIDSNCRLVNGKKVKIVACGNEDLKQFWQERQAEKRRWENILIPRIKAVLAGSQDARK